MKVIIAKSKRYSDEFKKPKVYSYKTKESNYKKLIKKVIYQHIKQGYHFANKSWTPSYVLSLFEEAIAKNIAVHIFLNKNVSKKDSRSTVISVVPFF